MLLQDISYEELFPNELLALILPKIPGIKEEVSSEESEDDLEESFNKSMLNF